MRLRPELVRLAACFQLQFGCIAKKKKKKEGFVANRATWFLRASWYSTGTVLVHSLPLRKV